MADNKEFGLQDRLDNFRRELDGKIDKKISDSIFVAAVVIFVGFIGGICFWLMNMNERITRVETKVEIQAAINQPTVLPSLKK